MADDLKQTVRILRRAKVATDDRGRTVWVDPIETAELELVSTSMLKRVLSSDDEDRKRKIKEVADGKDGVLAHDVENDSFEIIDDADLQAILDSVPQGMDAVKAADVIYTPLHDRADSDDELSLVSTQALRRILNIEDEPQEAEEKDDDKGFNPYDMN
jgi:hypothetical protein